MVENNKERIAAEVRKVAVDERLSCAQAFALAERLAVKPRDIGKVADELQIRIVACQLGLFK